MIRINDIVPGIEARFAARPSMAYIVMDLWSPIWLVAPRMTYSALALECTSMIALFPCSMTMMTGRAGTPQT